jgi:hypothetical protein
MGQLAHDLEQPDAETLATAEEVTKLVQEALAAYQGALVRRERIDGGLCEIADCLLDEIAAMGADWSGLPTVLGIDDSLDPLSTIIHVRYPTESVWALPLVAHELGHHVAFSITHDVWQGLHRQTVRPVEELLEQEYEHFKDVSAWSQLNELFADVFATWTAGPAYACSLLMLRLDRARPDDGTFQHPPPSSRVMAVLRTLCRTDEVQDSYLRSNTVLANRLESWWAANTGRAAPMTTLSTLLPHLAPTLVNHRTVERRLDAVLGIVEHDLADARHRMTDAARRIEDELTELDGRGVPTAAPGARVLDVLTAAWRARTRLEPKVSEATLTRRAEALCLQIAQSSSPKPRREE